MTIKEQLIEEIEQADEERLTEFWQLWQSTQKSSKSPAKFMRFAGVAQDDAEILQQIEQDIETNRNLDLQRPQAKTKQYQAINDSIRTAQFIRNKCFIL